MDKNSIELKGVRVNNLKNFNLSIPLNKFIVVTGVSGSGKSSLAFDTLYAEGQRRYVESLSAYARQFLTRMPKPECDFISGLPPSIAIEQRVNTRNPRSTVGTSTEIYDYLRMLFAKIGRTFSPISGVEVKKHSIDDIIAAVNVFPQGTRIAVLVKLNVPEGRDFRQHLDMLLKQGFSRLEKNGDFLDIQDLLLSENELDPSEYNLLIDRLMASYNKEEISRLTDSVETAYYEGNDQCIIKIWTEDGIKELSFSKKFEADGIEFREPSDLMFNFNNPYGACPECEGFGKVMGISEDLVIPDKTLSIYQDAVQAWRGEKMSEWKRYFINLAKKNDFPVHAPYSSLTKKQKDFLWHGNKDWEGIDGFFDWVDTQQYKIQYRVLKARYRGKTICPVCNGYRLREDASFVKVDGHTIQELVTLPIEKLRETFINLNLSETDRIIGKRLLTEIISRLDFLYEVGLGYLTLDRLSSTLSGGESQRINLATSLGSSLVGSLYILDEPSIGLHPRDTYRLISVLRKLQETGNTVLVVEHDEEIMNAADQLIDIGKDAGSLGGNVVFNGKLSEVTEVSLFPDSYTLKYLKGKEIIDYSPLRRPWKKFIEIKGANENNLKNLDVKFPLGIMTVVTGVSGSGKSTLVKEILYKGIARLLGEPGMVPGSHSKIEGDIENIKNIYFVDQNPIGTSTRSNPATYLKAYDEIRKLFSEQQLSKQLGFSPSYFSFNSEGGRCEECKGEGKILVPMQFMADMQLECEVCEGKRFKKEVLEVQYRGKSIYDVLEMTVNEAIDFFNETNGTAEKRIVKKLKPLQDVGLGYIKLGQSSSTLSGGENQRVKLAYFLSEESHGQNLFIFDEPTTGLHFNDIATLLKSLNALIDRGNSVIIIEHNLDMIKSADWIIDIGPEGGEKGGEIIAQGIPEDIVKSPKSYTGKYLLPKLHRFKD
ncbi:MAG: excinuclease ABC subunit UvrA [Muribaculaceae bacterium]|nr:excinuclease ABC subunit UvrA [Muribaculaceae bacterium]